VDQKVFMLGNASQLHGRRDGELPDEGNILLPTVSQKYDLLEQRLAGDARLPVFL
jgi:hypothetical protein